MSAALFDVPATAALPDTLNAHARTADDFMTAPLTTTLADHGDAHAADDIPTAQHAHVHARAHSTDAVRTKRTHSYHRQTRGLLLDHPSRRDFSSPGGRKYCAVVGTPLAVPSPSKKAAAIDEYTATPLPCVTVSAHVPPLCTRALTIAAQAQPIARSLRCHTISCPQDATDARRASCGRKWVSGCA